LGPHQNAFCRTIGIVPFGYLFPVALLAFCTATAVIGPRPARTTQGFWGLWATFLINELPFLALYLLAATSALAFAEGDLGSPGGLAVFTVAVLTAAGLAILIRRAAATGEALRRALAVDAGIDLTRTRRPWARILLAPFAVGGRQVVRVGDLAYGDGGRRNLLDVYHRRDRPTGGPVLVFFHGGGLRSGHKRREGRALLNHLAARGWVCVSANYRFTESHADARRVVAWVREAVASHGGDPRRIVVAGSSAGANLATTLALTSDDIAAAIGFYGYYGETHGPGSAPADLARDDAPPMLFLHGDKDSSTLIEDTRELAARLRKVSNRPVVLAELPGAQHNFDLFYSLRYSHVMEAVAAFGARVLP
jgi:acetyl esterase/lipase